MTARDLTTTQATAALLIAEGQLTFTEVAAKVGVSRQALCYWRKQPNFRQQFARHVEELTRPLREAGIQRERERARSLYQPGERLYTRGTYERMTTSVSPHRVGATCPPPADAATNDHCGTKP